MKRIRKLIRNIRFKIIVKTHDKFMYDYCYCMTRKKGVTNLMVYKAAMSMAKYGHTKNIKKNNSIIVKYLFFGSFKE